MAPWHSLAHTIRARAAATLPPFLFSSQTMQTFSVPSSQTVGQFLQQSAQRLAPIVAFILASVLFTYDAGKAIGQAMHSLNNKLAAIASANLRKPSPTIAQSISQQSPANPPKPFALSQSPMLPILEKISPKGRKSLANLLKLNGLSVAQMSEILGVSQSSVRRYLATV